MFIKILVEILSIFDAIQNQIVRRKLLEILTKIFIKIYNLSNCAE